MTEEKQPARDNKSSRKSSRRRTSRRRRERKPAGDAGVPREQPNAKGQPDKSLDKAQRERRERRRRRRQQAKRQETPEVQIQSGTLAQDEELNRPSPRVVVYTHVIRPDVRDSYEFRSEHFSKVTRRLEDFRIDLTPFLRSVEEDEERIQNPRDFSADDADDDWDADDGWDDDEGKESEESSENAAPGATVAQSPTVDELENVDDTDPDAGDNAGDPRANADSNR